MTTRESKNPVLLLILALGLLLPALPALAGDDGEAVEDVRVRVVRCEDGDCEEMDAALDEDVEVVVGKGDAKKIVIRKVHCDGEDCEEHAETHNMVFVGDDGDIEVRTGNGGHKWVRHHGFAVGGGYLGVGLTELTPELREHFGVSADEGVMVSKVMDDSPAAKAGLQAGDIITSVDGESIADGMALSREIRGLEAGDVVLLDVWRDGAPTALSATVEERKALGMGGAHHGMHPKMMRKIVVECDSDEGDCTSNAEIAGLEEFDCGGSGECKVEVECHDDGCDCTVNGEDTDCSGIPGVPGR